MKCCLYKLSWVYRFALSSGSSPQAPCGCSRTHIAGSSQLPGHRYTAHTHVVCVIIHTNADNRPER